MMQIDEWLKRLQSDGLPVLRQTTLEFARLALHGESVAIPELAAAVLHDPLMTLKVLHDANSRHASRLGTEITSVEHAIMMLGVTSFFKHFQTQRTIENYLVDNPHALTKLLSVISCCHHAAFQSWNWAVMRNDIKAEEIYIAAFLHDLPEMLLWLLASDQMIQIEDSRRHMGLSAQEAQQQVLGFTLDQLQPPLLQKWGFPEHLYDMMCIPNATNPRTQLVHLAVAVARHSRWGWYGSALENDFEAIAALLHHPLDEIVSLIHRNAVAAARQEERYGVTPAAAWLPMLPGDWPDDPAGLTSF